MEGQGDLGYELRVGSRVTVGHKQGSNEQEKREREELGRKQRNLQVRLLG